MYVSQLDLANFRSYPKLSLELDLGITAFTGANGVGKTNIVEAIYFVATLSSHRVANRIPLIQSDAERAIIRLRARNGDRTSAIELEIPQTGQGRARVNSGQVIPVGQTRGILRAVMFSPEDLTTINGEPEARRRFLDELVLQAKPAMAGNYRDYDQVLRQRNAYLKNAKYQGNLNSDVLNILTDQLIQLGADITLARIALLNHLQPVVAHHYQQIADAPTEIGLALAALPGLAVAQRPDDAADAAGFSEATAAIDAIDGIDPIGTSQNDDLRQQLVACYQQQFTSQAAQELARGYTLAGPHRDDLLATVGGLPAKGYASHGEKWSLALSLKLAAFDYLTKEYANYKNDQDNQPILILDDVFAELDQKRRTKLSAAIQQAQQVLITSAVAADIPAELNYQARQVTKGQVA